MTYNRWHDKLVKDVLERIVHKHDDYQLEAELWVGQHLLYVTDILTFDTIKPGLWWVTTYEEKTGWNKKTVATARDQAKRYFTWLDQQTKYVGNNFVMVHRPRGSRKLTATRWTRKDVMPKDYWS